MVGLLELPKTLGRYKRAKIVEVMEFLEVIEFVGLARIVKVSGTY